MRKRDVIDKFKAMASMPENKMLRKKTIQSNVIAVFFEDISIVAWKFSGSIVYNTRTDIKRFLLSESEFNDLYNSFNQ